MPAGNNPIPNFVLNRLRQDEAQSAAHDLAAAAAAAAAAGVDSITARPEHAAEMVATEKNVIESFPRYRTMLAEMIEWWRVQYPDLYSKIVFEISDDYDREIDAQHYYSATHDLKYHLLDPKWVKLYVSAEKKWKDKAKGIQYGFDHPRKYSDAVLKCAGVSSYGLHPKYRTSMKAFLDNLKKEKAKAKGKRQLDQQEADAIGFGLYEKICEWAVDSGTVVGIFCWAFITTQWNVMGRTVNVDPLGFHNLVKSQHDSVIFLYDSNKKDKKGEKVTPKNCYANPSRPLVSLFLALGCYLSIFQNKFKRDSDKIFRAQGKDGSASNSYAKAIQKLVRGKCAAEGEKRQKIVRDHGCRDGHFHMHGVRKGSGTHVTTCTMDPPPIPSVLLRGEWSLGKVLEVYWKYSMVGDTYLGRCLAGFNPDKAGFGTLPPHFREGTENEDVMEGMRLCFGGILDRFGGEGIEGALLLFLASIVYHADTFILPKIASDAKHPFLSIPILSKPKLLSKLRDLVTLEPAGDVQQATGVPRHAKVMDELRDVVAHLNGYVDEVRDLKKMLPTLVKDAIDEKASESGHVTASFVLEQVTEAIGKATDSMEEKITTAVEKATAHLGEVKATVEVPPPPIPSKQAVQVALYKTYKYHDANANARNKARTDWDVPVDFDFPTADLYVAWTAWLLGYPSNKSKDSAGKMYDAPVKPLRLLKFGHLPAKVKKKFDNAWRPILELMNNEVAATIATTCIEKMNERFIRSTYDLALRNVCLKFPDIRAALIGGRAISTCSKAVKSHTTQKRKGGTLLHARRRTAD